MRTKTDKRKNKLRKTKKHVIGGDGEKEIKYIIRKSKLDDKNVMFQVFVNAVPTDFSITNLLQNNMNMVDEMLARLRRKKENDDDIDIIHEETINIGHTPPKPDLQKTNIEFEFDKFFREIKAKVKTLYDVTTASTKATSDLDKATETVKNNNAELEKLKNETKTATDASNKAKEVLYNEVEAKSKAKLKEEAEAKE
jgi:hypothetical protein